MAPPLTSQKKLLAAEDKVKELTAANELLVQKLMDMKTKQIDEMNSMNAAIEANRRVTNPRMNA